MGISYDITDGIAEVIMDNPPVNALRVAGWFELAEILRKLGDDPDVRAVILAAEGKGFNAGVDIKEMQQTEGFDALLGANRGCWEAFKAVYECKVPVICAVNGVAAGAGANIALACDIVIAAKSAKFIQAFSKIALIPDAGGTYWLTRLVGEARAKALALTAHPLSAEDAAQWGLIWRAVPDEELMAEAEKLAAGFAAGPTAAYALTKEVIHAASTNSLDEQLDLERRMQRQAGMSDDYKEGVAAFLQKRPADYRKAKR